MVKRRVAAAPRGVVKKESKRKTDKWADVYDPVKHTRGFGGMPPPRHDVRRWVKWPRYIRIQRQRASLWMRLRVPPTINQFTNTLDRNNAHGLYRLLWKYRPETKKDKQIRLQKEAEARAEQKEDEKKKPICVRFGLNHVTSLVERKEAQLVAIANDVHPLEMVLWLPTLCKKMDVPFCIVKDKSRLGTIVHQKTAAVVALTAVRSEDQKELARLADICIRDYNAVQKLSWGGGVLGQKAIAKEKKRLDALEREKNRKLDA